MLDELVADWIGHSQRLPSNSSVMDLMRWAYSQTQENSLVHTAEPDPEDIDP